MRLVYADSRQRWNRERQEAKRDTKAAEVLALYGEGVSVSAIGERVRLMQDSVRDLLERYAGIAIAPVVHTPAVFRETSPLRPVRRGRPTLSRHWAASGGVDLTAGIGATRRYS